jgi:hypothetical protein
VRRRLSENSLQLNAGGPRLLTEDRQKPGCRRAVAMSCAAWGAGGRHGTRNTVPSRAARPSGEARVLAKT